MNTAETQVFFVTNREKSAAAGENFTNSPLPSDSQSLFYGSANVSGIEIDIVDSGVIDTIGSEYGGGFSAADFDKLVKSEKDILVFVHGTSNIFNSAITRAAYNKIWLQEADIQGFSTDFEVIVFSWPSHEYSVNGLIGFLENLAEDILGEVPDLTANYRTDQANAMASAGHFGLFLQQLYQLRAHIGNRRINLLCHSMGNYMLAGAVEKWLGDKKDNTYNTAIFNEIILVAADEEESTFGKPWQRLAGLWKIGQAISVYYSNDDRLLRLSNHTNGVSRLGYNGPVNKADTGMFLKDVYAFINCTHAVPADYIPVTAPSPDHTHQYYRMCPVVRLDIACTLSGADRPDKGEYDIKENVYSLFKPQPCQYFKVSGC